MQKFDRISEDLFKKLRGKFPAITIGDAEGNVTNEPSEARFFDFSYNNDGTDIGKVSISISEQEGLTVIYSNDIVEFQDDITKKQWFNFLKELRVFSKKRLLDFSIRDINKSNLTKKDYKFLATNRSGDGKMTESKLYGTSRVSYQKVGEARIIIKHTESINQESATGRTQKIGKIYIESPEGERFKYPYKHLSGARAMARHVAEGGNTYDDFGKHIVGLSEEMAKLRKFKNYMSRSAVMAESLAGYTDIVKERIATVKKEIASLQKPAYYKEAFETFNPPVLEDVPSDVAENWIDELTIKQFNEELQDIFPYIYNLVKEGTKAKELGPDDVLGESEEELDEVAPLIAAGVMAAARAAIPQLSRMGASILAKRGAAIKAAKARIAARAAGQTAGQAVGQAAGQVARSAGQAAGQVARGAGNYIAKNPGTTAALGGAAYVGKQVSDTIDDLATSAEELMDKASQGINGIQDEISAFLGGGALRQIGASAAKYGLPVLAVIAILYGGKKVINWLMGKGDEPRTEEIEFDEGERHGNSKIYDKCRDGWRKKPGATRGSKGSCIPEETALEQGFEEMMGQFSEAENDLEEAYIKTRKDAVEALGRLRGIGKKIETGKDTYDGNLANEYVSDVYDVYSWMDSKLGISGMNDPKLKEVLEPVMQLRGEAKKLETKPGSGENARFGNQIVNALYPLMVYIRDVMEDPKDESKGKDLDKDGDIDSDDYMKAKDIAIKKAMGKDDEEDVKEQKTPLGEFILSYYDRETGEFPKGETAVLTMVEKDYGEQFIEPAKAFIEQVQALYDDYQMQTQPQQMEVDTEFGRMKELAGLR